ncbi:hypothetical protein C5167_024372 [Papaver somniferum]|uniref:RING-type domain-containing protein n=1 Tax=Papaver somniferum TaxID=3469 RepID=A0A4Y7JS13_PAPSO|nr:E3 ubiquitin protein ligase DRIP2-like [Papaver somniferum]RZC62598.1 hypothetical protein C5167_024372 [Papaver somniferum]
MMTGVLKVRKETLAACMTCPLCSKLLKEATTVSECLHTFCRKCIYKKLTDEDYCPVCNIYLGTAPEEKLRPDHNLQDLRAKIFPFKRRKVKAPGATPPTIPLPVRRKERSLSSLSTPRVSTLTTLTGKRTRGVGKKAAGDTAELVKKGKGSLEDYHETTSLPETLSKIAQNRRQASSSAEPSNHQAPNKDQENDIESGVSKIHLWKPLNCFFEAANTTKSHKFTIQGSVVKFEPANDSSFEVRFPKTKVRDTLSKSAVQDDEKGSSSTASEHEKPRKLHKIRKRSALSERDHVTAPTIINVEGLRRDRRTSPIWFTLVASDDQEGAAPLPQISACYLRIQDGSIPVSCIQKYLMKKLDLTSESMVEIRCQGQPVLPHLQLHNLIDLWLKTSTASQRNPVSIGTSAEDFVMVLAYSRKVLPS